MTYSIATLPWLPEPDAAYTDRLKELVREPTGAGPVLQQLATARVNVGQALSFGRALKKLVRAGADLSPLAPFRLAVVSNGSIEFAADHFAVASARHGVALDLVTTEFDQVIQEALNPGSSVNASDSDAVLTAVDHRGFGLDKGHALTPASLDAALDQYFTAAAAFREHSKAAVILATVATPPTQLFGSYDRRVTSSLATQIGLINQAILERSATSGYYVLDVDRMAQRVGTDRWFDPVTWNAQKQPFSPEFHALYADRLGSLLGAIRGKARKCLVLDLDNSCWGGAIGDEGMDGIVLGEGSAKGEAFLAVQRLAKDYRDRGIILAVCSKNNHETAIEPFRSHPEMVLREGDIAVFQANWTDKPSNLEAIAETLSIGIDALVMLDDNPAERAQIRAALPMVGVPELPEDPSWYPWFLQSAGYFETVSFGEDDLKRAESYAADARRAAVRETVRDLGNYLESLKMEMVSRPFDQANRPRITQLFNKTNQFNLATNRYTESEVEEWERSATSVTRYFRLADNFGDLGLIAMVTATVDDQRAEIVDWLMSCRVLGRKVEEAMANIVLSDLVLRGVTEVAATYKPTRKNNMVREHYDRLGFDLVGEDDDGTRRYRLGLAGWEPASVPIAIDSEADAHGGSIAQ